MAGGLDPSQNNEDQGPLTVAVVWAVTALTTLVVLCRLYIRQWVMRNAGLDDWFITTSTVFAIIFCVMVTLSVAYGYGQHTMALPIEDAQKALLYNMLAFIFGIVSFALPKLGVAALLDRLLNPAFWNRCVIWGLTGAVAAIAVVNILIYITMCDPPRGLWEISLVMKGEAKCRDVWILINYATFNGAFSAFTDLYLAIYPGFVLFKLNMSLRKKIWLSVALGLGVCAAACAVVKCAQLKGLANKSDATFGTVPLIIWTNIEADVVIIAACIPTLHPLLEMIMGKRALYPSSRSQRRYQQYGNIYGSESHKGHRRQRSPKQQLRTTNPKIGTSSESQESVLPAGDGAYTIRRTDDVRIEYEMQPQLSPAKKHSFP